MSLHFFLIYIYIYMCVCVCVCVCVWFGLVSWHINYCRLSNAKFFFFYTYNQFYFYQFSLT